MRGMNLFGRVNRCYLKFRALNFLSILIPAILLSGCTDLNRLRSQEIAELSDTTTGLVIDLDIKLTDPSHGQEPCFISLQPLGSLKNFEIALPGHRTIAFFPLPAGDYVFDLLSCGEQMHWQIRQVPPTVIHVREGRISIVEPKQFKVRQGYALSLLKVSPETYGLLVRNLAQMIPRRLHDRLINAYTELPVNLQELSRINRRRPSAHFSDGTKKTARLSLMQLPTEQCLRKELDQNLLVLGNLEVRVFYKNRKWANTQVIDNRNSFSPSLMECLNEEWKSHRPESADEVSYLFVL